MKAGSGDQVGELLFAGWRGVDAEFDDGLAELLWGEDWLVALEIRVYVEALVGRVGGDGGRAEISRRGQLWEQGDEADAQAVAARFLGCVGADESDGGFGAGVAAAERRAAQRRAAGQGNHDAAGSER